MKTNDFPTQPAGNILALPAPTRQGRIPARPTLPRQRFRILTFANIGGSTAYRVQGMKRDRTYVRKNFASLNDAQHYQIELEAEYLKREPDSTNLRYTRLSETQLRIAESAFPMLTRDEDMILAVQHWLQRAPGGVVESPRLDDATQQFWAWLDATASLRDQTKKNLRQRVGVFANSMPNLAVDRITPELIEEYLEKRAVSAVTQDNDKRALSRFFSWCLERPRRWTAINPCSEVHVERGQTKVPAVLTVDQCKTLMTAAEGFRDGKLVPALAVQLFGGLRPWEAARLNWQAVNLADGEIRLEASQTKTGSPRLLVIGPTLRAWLAKYRDLSFHPLNFRDDLFRLKAMAGLTQWPQDVLRHTAASHYFRATGSYGQTAEQFGNSEAVIKQHYQGRVSSEETKRFYAIMPAKKG